jgi:mono/diheme cytochrome c family protein
LAVKVSSVCLLVALASLGLAGCGQPPEAVFAPNQEKVGSLLPEARTLVADTLKDQFGTPSNLVAWEKFKIDYGKADLAADDAHKHHREPGWRLIDGRNLYMQHCLHCHGVAGDGNGPTARFLNPRPRDYRQGIFKFKSTKGPARPQRADIVHILEQGIPGTYMPSFVLLGTEKLELIADYVRWLSIRGNVEIQLADTFAGAGATEGEVAASIRNDESKTLTRDAAVKAAMKPVQDDLAESIQSAVDLVSEKWAEAENPESVVTPAMPRVPPTGESIEKGRLLFLSLYPDPKAPDPKKQTKCSDCHGVAGRGDGPNTQTYWKNEDSKPVRKYDAIGLHDKWGFPSQPRDLTRGIYRGGRRPVDLYRRIQEGIPGTAMPGFANSLTPEEIWHVVNFVFSVPFEGKRSAYPTELEEQGAAEHKEVADTQQ